MHRSRPAPRWCHASTGLDDFALVTWAVDPDRVAATLPTGFVPDVRAGVALVSAVAFVDDRFHFRGLPWPRVSCGQVNYRAYVQHQDESGVWFFGTSLDSALVRVPRLAWKMPWHRDRLRVDANWTHSIDSTDSTGERCRSWRLTATGGWGAASIALYGTGEPYRPPDGFAGPDEVRELLLDPFVGWYARRDGSGVGRYSVWHEPLALEQAIVDEATSQVFTDLSLIDDGQVPVSAGLQRHVHFDVHTPPTRLSNSPP